MPDIIYNIIGVSGSMLALIAFYLLENGKLKSHDFSYLLMNLFAAIFILISLSHNWNLPAFVIEVIWAGISIYGIVSAYRKKLWLARYSINPERTRKKNN